VSIAKARVKKTGPEVRAELEAIRERSGLTAKTVERAARNPKSPLHQFFTWNDTHAAYLHRLDEARDLLQCVLDRREDILGGKPYRAYLNVRSGFKAEPEYRPVEVVLSSKKLREQMLQAALSDAEQWRNRYRILVELARIFSAIKTTKRDLDPKPKGPKKK
jgi:hypothetical protein